MPSTPAAAPGRAPPPTTAAPSTPPRPMLASAAVAIGATAALAAAPFIGRAGSVASAACLLAAALARGRAGDAVGRNAALLTALALGTRLLPGGWWAWPAPVALFAAAALRRSWRGPGGLVAWLRAGAVRPSDVAWALAIAAASAVALVAWTLVRHPDLTDLTRALPAMPPALLLAGGIGWAVLNAFGEEAIFRGALLEALDRASGPRVALAAQAIAFGLVHWRGFPRGPDGVVLAAIYGLMLGVIRRRTGGLVAPVLAHVFADVAILCLLVAAA